MADDPVARPVIRPRAGARPPVSVHEQWPGGPLPALIRANVPGVDLPTWIRGHRDTVNELTRRVGAVLLRGFAVTDPDEFRAVMQALSPSVLSYGERSSPRSQVAPGVYTSTDHPPDQPIELHNEQSYTLDWPLRIVFCCQVAPAYDGRTPLADSRRVLARLDPRTVAAFTERGVCYQRNYLPGISLSWQEAFQTSRRQEVEQYCRRAGIDVEWVGPDHLRTRQVRPAVRRHPYTGEATWFNHALFFHVTSLPEQITAGLLAGLAERDLPYQTYYGDGQPIAAHTLAELRACYAAETTAFDWQRGDVLVVENMIVAHGREPFRGPRRILAAMADPYSATSGADFGGGR